MKTKLFVMICFSVVFLFYMGSNSYGGNSVLPAVTEAEGMTEDTIAWMNATYAVQTELVEGDITIFAGFPRCDKQKKSRKLLLENDWEIRKKKDVNEVILWLVNSGDRETMGEDAIAWDYGRAMQISAGSYLAGYYTEKEALDMQLAVSQIIQEHFSSWEEYVDSYLLGVSMKYSEEETEKWREAYNQLSSSEKNPFDILWETKLDKVW